MYILWGSEDIHLDLQLHRSLLCPWHVSVQHVGEEVPEKKRPAEKKNTP